MNKGVGLALIFFLVLLLGTHPGSTAELMHDALAVLNRAGEELSSFVSKI